MSSFINFQPQGGYNPNNYMTSQSLGEEGGGLPLPYPEPYPQASTMAAGEEGGYVSDALGEGGMSTMGVGEEGGQISDFLGEGGELPSPLPYPEPTPPLVRYPEPYPYPRQMKPQNTEDFLTVWREGDKNGDGQLTQRELHQQGTLYMQQSQMLSSISNLLSSFMPGADKIFKPMLDSIKNKLLAVRVMANDYQKFASASPVNYVTRPDPKDDLNNKIDSNDIRAIAEKDGNKDNISQWDLNPNIGVIFYENLYRSGHTEDPLDKEEHKGINF